MGAGSSSERATSPARTARLKLTLPKPAAAVFECNLVEDEPWLSQSHGETVTASMKAFSPKTLKILFEDTQ